MLDLLEITSNAKREDSASGATEETKFASIYFSYYPYLVG